MSFIGIDFGAKRIGVAYSESGIIATPHSVVKNEGDPVSRIARIGDDLAAEVYVVGIARRAHTAQGEQRFRDFAERLRQQTCRRVVLWNEALSSIEAAERLREARIPRRQAERDIDMHAAAVILQSYLDAQAGRPR